jgi:hypothetical protein
MNYKVTLLFSIDSNYTLIMMSGLASWEGASKQYLLKNEALHLIDVAQNFLILGLYR